MISPAEALKRIRDVAYPLPPVTRQVSRALGQILAQPAKARNPVPLYDVAAVDGYALRLEGTGKTLPVAFTVKAGESPPPLPPGTCARVFTGALIPAGAEAVVAQEDVLRHGQDVDFPASIGEGLHIRKAGEICEPGEVLLKEGTQLTPAAVALLLAAGIRSASFFPKPKVAMVVTGNELTRGKPAPGQIVDTNTPMLAGLLSRKPVELVCKMHAEDAQESLREALSRALERADFVITTGGVSVGDFDLLPQLVAALGGEVLFHKVAMQPGKPILAARFGKKILLGLPGNPVSALVGYRLFADPWLRALAGDPQAFADSWQPFPVSKPVANQGHRHQFLPAVVDRHPDGPWISPVPWKGSHDLRAAAIATHLMHLPPGFSGQRGDQVQGLAIL
ncbi:MAG: molybdopterin molybdotransferase MoeA [Thermoanaerobaculaceae bacterium]